MKLEVGPGSLIPLPGPMPCSLVVSTAEIELLEESKAATMLRLGEIAIIPGELPALIGAIRGRVSSSPLMITSPGNVPRVETPWEAKTRSGKPLAFGVDFLLPHERKQAAAHNPTTRARTRFFKRQAPNNMKKRDLLAKCWIIADCVLCQPDRRMRELAFILYSQHSYGGQLSCPIEAVSRALRWRNGNSALRQGRLHQSVLR